MVHLTVLSPCPYFLSEGGVHLSIYSPRGAGIFFFVLRVRNLAPFPMEFR